MDLHGTSDPTGLLSKLKPRFPLLSLLTAMFAQLNLILFSLGSSKHFFCNEITHYTMTQRLPDWSNHSKQQHPHKWRYWRYQRASPAEGLATKLRLAGYQLFPILSCDSHTSYFIPEITKQTADSLATNTVLPAWMSAVPSDTCYTCPTCTPPGEGSDRKRDLEVSTQWAGHKGGDSLSWGHSHCALIDRWCSDPAGVQGPGHCRPWGHSQASAQQASVGATLLPSDLQDINWLFGFSKSCSWYIKSYYV